jgi:opacity protein-like surface antigen
MTGSGMCNRILAAAAVAMIVSASPAYAQRVEVSGLFGWTLSDGVTGDPVLAADGNIYDTVDLKDGFSWGLAVGVNATDNIEVGFLFGQQQSTLALDGTTARDVGDLTINTYHPYFAFNAGAADAKVRPYLMIGLGATNYSSVSFTRANGQADETGSQTQFSTTWGAGVKVFPSPKVGVRFGLQWTPTYIKSDAEGWWCDPYWGCYVVSNAQYANQFQFNGGVTFRF